MAITENQRSYLEGATGRYKTTVEDEDGDAIPLASVSTLTLTFIDKKTRQIINSREAQDVLNTNNCTYHATSGLLTWNIQATDNVLVKKHEHDNPDKQEHLARFTLTTTGGKIGIHEVTVIVRRKVK